MFVQQAKSRYYSGQFGIYRFWIATCKTSHPNDCNFLLYSNYGNIDQVELPF